jgi:predicted nucleic acid-binding protein
VAGQEQELVVDSSVAVKWFSEEEDTDKALLLKERHVRGLARLWASDLLYHEVANALRFKPAYDESRLMAAVESLFDLHLNVHRTDAKILSRASSIALNGEVTVYDAVPVALAEMKSTVCITSDELTQYKRLKARDYPVRLLRTQKTAFGVDRERKVRLTLREHEEFTRDAH